MGLVLAAVIPLVGWRLHVLFGSFARLGLLVA